MAQVRNILADVKKIDTIETTVSTVSSNVSQLQTEVTNFDALPSQANQAGKYLTTNGADASWETISQPTLVSQLSNDVGYQTGAQVIAAVAGLVDSAPGTLDTLNELAAALGDDPNFATSVTNMVAGKLDYTTLADGTGHGFKVGPHLSYYAIQTESTKSGIYFNDGLGFIKANYVPVLYWDSSKVTIKNSSFTDTITLNGTNGNVTAAAFIGDGSGLTGLSSYTDSNVASYLTANNYVDTTALNTALSTKANTSSLSTVATSGSYNDLLNKPTIPIVPTNISGFTNDSGYATTSQLVFKKYGDVSSAGNLNDQAIRNSAFYSLNAINAPNSNNGVGLYLSSYGLGGSNDDSTNERAAQLYFGDTPASGLHYRVKQGTSGWHPWVALSSGIKGIWYNSTNAHTYTTTPDGFTTLETTFVRTNPSSFSKFLIIATVAGAAGDDGHARLEFYDGTNWVVPAELIGQGNTGSAYANGSFGDFSITRATEDKQILQYTATIMHSPASTAGTLGYRVRMMAENVGGLYMNRPMGWDNGFNSNTSRSSIIIMEMTGNNNG